MRDALIETALGFLVEVDDPRGVGVLVARDEQTAEVEFFYSATRSERARFPAAAVRRTYLSPQTRVYLRSDDGRWRMGRVRDFLLEADGGVTYEVRLPNKQDLDVPERALRVRCFAGTGDPSEVLALGSAETQRWFDARWSARETLVSLRAASEGLTGLISASVELVGYQADAVRRILHDPLQRYLLADEVGLGKTIEACAVLRQTLIDAPGSTALVLAPDVLVPQWERELAAKFGLGSELGGRVRIMAHGALDRVSRRSTILIVDEAHRFAPGSEAYARLASLAAGADKLLLLSATPVIGHEETLLALLRLLDPDRWESEPLDRFRQHVAQSQEYGRLLLGLRPDASAFVLKQRVLAARATFPDDPIVADLASRFSEAATPEARALVCARLREHIADTYRIHHRIVRARRSDLEGWEFEPRGPASVREEEDDDPSLADAATAVEDWRARALLATEERPAFEDEIAGRYLSLLEAVALGGCQDELPHELFEGERDLTAAVHRSLGPNAGERRAEFAAEVAERQLRFLRKSAGAAPKLVVFSSDKAIAAKIAARLRDRLGVGVFEGAADPEFARAFEAHPGPSVAVLARDGEEGLNLHFADSIVHADLPFSIGRIEQRIGRLDRFGRSKGPIKHVVVNPAGDEATPWSAWLSLLRAGYEVFDRPMSDVQFALDQIEAEVGRRALRGPETVAAFGPELNAQIVDHRARLNEQYALDQLAMSRDSARTLVEAIEEAEVDEPELERRVNGFLAATLQLKIRNADPDVFSLAWAPDTQLPARPWRPVFEHALRRPLTWKRRISVARPDVSLVRPGSELVDALEHLIEWDDRGTAFATWRFRPGLGGWGDERLVFRLSWVVGPREVDQAQLLAGESAEGLRRKAQALLPPWTLTQHIGPDLEPIIDADLLALVERSYAPEAQPDGSRDFNLGSRADWLNRVIDRQAFATLCSSVRKSALDRLERSVEYRERLSRAVQAVTQETDRRAARRAIRSRATPAAAPEREAALDQLVLDIVSQPNARLDCIGAIVVAGHIPQARR